MKGLLLVDGLNLVRRIYEARGGATDQDFIVAVRQSLERCLEDLRPSHAVVIWDSHSKTWRHELDDSYKANRPPTPQPLLDSIPQLNETFHGLHVENLTIANYEADDVIATMAVAVSRSAKIEAVVLSTDKMFYPLLIDGVRIYHQFDREWMSKDLVVEKYGLEIDQLIDYWALSGDNSNNIKGVPGIGKKTATELLQAHGSIQGILDADVSKKLTDHADLAMRCQQLVQLKTDVELGVNLKDFRRV